MSYSSFILHGLIPIAATKVEIDKKIEELENKYFKIKDSTKKRIPKSPYRRKTRGRLMKFIEKEWRFYKSMQSYYEKHFNI